MPRTAIPLLSLALACAACAPSGQGNDLANAPSIRALRSAVRSGVRQPAATISVAAAGGGACAVRWNGEAVTPEMLLQRATGQLQGAIERMGGVQHLTEDNMPFVRLEAPPETAMSCIAPTLASLQHAGFADVALRPAGGAEGADARAWFMLQDGPDEVRPTFVVALGAGGRMTLNGRPIDLAGLRASAPAGGSETFDERPPPGDFVIALSADVTFGALYEAVRGAGNLGGAVAVSGCARAGMPTPDVETLSC